MKGVLAFVFVLGLASTASSSNSDPSEAPAICAAEGSDGILVSHKECDKFYKCSEGLPVVLDCPEGLLWNTDLEVCDWPDNVKCGSGDKDTDENVCPESSESEESDSSEAPEICADEGSDGILVAHEECDKFYECSGGEAIEISCPTGLLWNADKDICDWPENVNCKPKEGTKICASQPSGTLLPHEKCNEFYLCNQGDPVAMACAANLKFDAEKKICNWPEQVDCGDRT